MAEFLPKINEQKLVKTDLRIYFLGMEFTSVSLLKFFGENVDTFQNLAYFKETVMPVLILKKTHNFDGRSASQTCYFSFFCSNIASGRKVTCCFGSNKVR